MGFTAFLPLPVSLSLSLSLTLPSPLRPAPLSNGSAAPGSSVTAAMDGRRFSRRGNSQTVEIYFF